MKALLSLALVAALAFAGCASKGSDETTTDGADATGTTSGTGSTSGTSGTAAPTGSATSGAANRAPAISAFTTNLTVGGLTSVLAGKAVKFTFNATDADKDNLTFRLVFGDATTNATGKLPTKGVNHTYATAGNYTAKVFVSDGKLTVNKTLLVKVSVPDVGPSAPSAGQEAEMVWDLGFTDLTALTSVNAALLCEDGPTATFNYDSFTLDAATVGLPFKASIDDLTGGAAIAGWSLYFNLADCSDYAEIFSVDGAGDITGTIPANAGPYVFAMSTGGFLLEVQYTSGSKIV